MIEKPTSAEVQPEQGRDIQKLADTVLLATDDAARAKALNGLQALTPADKLKIADHINRTSALIARVTVQNELQVEPVRSVMGTYPMNLDGPLAGARLAFREAWDRPALQKEKKADLHPKNLQELYARAAREQKLLVADAIMNSLKPGQEPLTKRAGNPEDQRKYDEAAARYRRGFDVVFNAAIQLNKKPNELSKKHIQDALAPLNPPYTYEQFIADGRMEQLSLNERRVTVLEVRAMGIEMYQQLFELYLETKQKGGMISKENAPLEQKALASYGLLKQKIQEQMNLRAGFNPIADQVPLLREKNDRAGLQALLPKWEEYDREALRLNREIDVILQSKDTNGIVPFHTLILDLLKNQHAEVMKQYQKKDVQLQTKLELKAADAALKEKTKGKKDKLTTVEAAAVLATISYPGGLDQYLKDVEIDKSTASDRKKGLDALTSRSKDIIATMAKLNRRMGAYQIVLTELASKQHQFDQPVRDAKGSDLPVPGTTLDFTDPKEFTPYLREQYEGGLSTLEQHFHRMEEGPLKVGWKEKVEDIYIRHGRPTLFRLALKLVQLETAFVPNLGPLELKKRAQDYLEAGFDEVVGWPRHPDGRLMNEEEMNALPDTDPRKKRGEELRLSIEKAIRKFEGKNPDGSPIVVKDKDGKDVPKGNALEKMRALEREMQQFIAQYPPQSAANLLTAGPQTPEQQKAVQDFLEGKTDELVIGGITIPKELENDDGRLSLLDIAKKYNPQVAYLVAFMRMQNGWDEYSAAYTELTKDFGTVVNVHMEVGEWMKDFADHQFNIFAGAAGLACMAFMLALLGGLLGGEISRQLLKSGAKLTWKAGKLAILRPAVAATKLGVKGGIAAARAGAKAVAGAIPEKPIDLKVAGEVTEEQKLRAVLSKYNSGLTSAQVEEFLQAAKQEGIVLDKKTYALISESNRAKNIIAGAVQTGDMAEVTRALEAAKSAAKIRIGLNTVGIAGDIYGLVMAWQVWEANGQRIEGTSNPALQELYRESYKVQLAEGAGSFTGLVISGVAIGKTLIAGEGVVAALGTSAGLITLPISVAVMGGGAYYQSLEAARETWLKDRKDWATQSEGQLLAEMRKTLDAPSVGKMAAHGTHIETIIRQLRDSDAEFQKWFDEGTSLTNAADTNARFEILAAYLIRTTRLPQVPGENPEAFQQRFQRAVMDKMLYLSTRTQGDLVGVTAERLRFGDVHAELTSLSADLKKKGEKQEVTQERNGKKEAFDLATYNDIPTVQAEPQRTQKETMLRAYEAWKQAETGTQLTLLRLLQKERPDLQHRIIQEKLLEDISHDIAAAEARISLANADHYHSATDHFADTNAKPMARYVLSLKLRDELRAASDQLLKLKDMVTTADYGVMLQRIRAVLQQEPIAFSQGGNDLYQSHLFTEHRKESTIWTSLEWIRQNLYVPKEPLKKP